MDVYAAFIDGAKEGFEVAIRIIPYLIVILIRVGGSDGNPFVSYLLFHQKNKGKAICFENKEFADQPLLSTTSYHEPQKAEYDLELSTSIIDKQAVHQLKNRFLE